MNVHQINSILMISNVFPNNACNKIDKALCQETVVILSVVYSPKESFRRNVKDAW